jgi:hypothetical protein
MTIETFILTRTEAVYVVAALRIALDHMPADESDHNFRDRTIMKAVIDRLAAPLTLNPDVRHRLDSPDGETP